MSKNSTKKENGKVRMSPQKKWIVSLLAVILIIICGIIVMMVQISSRDDEQMEVPTSLPTTQQPTESEVMQETETTEHSVPIETTDVTESVETKAPSDATTEATTKTTADPTKATTATKGTTAKPSETTAPTQPATEPATEATEAAKPTEPVISEVVTTIDLPYVIPGTTLEVQRIADYDGIFLEDGTNETVKDVAMILIHNTGTQDVEYVEMTIVFEDGELAFNASAIPGNGLIVIQERDRNSVPNGKLLECRAAVAPIAGFEMSDELIQITDNGDDSLSVTNLTDEELVTVRLFYKYYMEENDVYVGGITYTAKISNLAAKSTIVIEPTHYSSESSKVVMVRTYDEDV